MSELKGVGVGLIMVLIFVAGFGLGYAVAPAEDGESLTESIGQFTGGESSTDGGGESAAAQSVSGATTLDASMMTDGQRQMLESMGMDPNNITITPEMIACAEGKLGSERVDAIMNGETPSMGEGVQLAACYSVN